MDGPLARSSHSVYAPKTSAGTKRCLIRLRFSRRLHRSRPATTTAAPRPLVVRHPLGAPRARPVPDLAGAPRAVHLALWIASRNQSETHPEIALLVEPRGPVHRRAIAERDNRADTRRRHQPAAHHVFLDGLQNPLVIELETVK